jgi:dTMP kinase
LTSSRTRAPAHGGGTVSDPASPGSVPDHDSDATDQLVDGGAQPSAYRALLQNRNYRLWFAASFTSSLGDWMGFVALQTLVASLFAPGTRPALFALGGVMMARLLPSVLMGPIAGVLADRYDRKRLIVFTDVSRFGLFVAIAFSSDLTALFALTFVVECLALLFMSSKDASLPGIIEKRHLTEANQLNLLVTYGTLPLGAVFAAAMIGVASLLGRVGLDGVEPARLALLADACTYLVSALLMSQLALPKTSRRTARNEGPGFVAELREGITFIRDLPLIRALITGVVGVFFGAGVVVGLGPVFVNSALGRPAADWSILITAVGAGLVAGIVAVQPMTRLLRKELLFPVCLAATGAIATVLAVLSNFAVILGVGVLLGVAAGLSFVQGYTLLHENTRDETRARTFAAFYTGTRVSLFAALGIAPFVAGTIGTASLFAAGRIVRMSGVRITMVLGGLVALFFGLLATRGMRRAVRDETERPLRMQGAHPARNRGLFIVFEGVEGAGKSTQVSALVATLRSEGRDVLVTREPGGPPVAERIRSILLDPDGDDMDDRTETLLYAAARAEHVDRVIRPALEQGQVVVCDRFVDSSLAYQGFARGLGEEDVFEINRWAVDGVLPDVVILLRLDAEEGMRRVTERARRKAHAEETKRAGGEPGAVSVLPQWAEQLTADRMERQGTAFHRKVAEGYLQLARRNKARFVVVEADGDAVAIAHRVRAGLHPWLPLPGAASEAVAGDGADAPAADRERPGAAP